MGIYGESLSLITEGKISKKIKKLYNKFLVWVDKENKKKGVETDLSHVKRDELNKKPKSIEHIASIEAMKIKQHGHFEFVRKYYSKNFTKIFSKITKDSAENYLDYIKNTFGYNTMNEIGEFFRREKYNEKNFLYSYDDLHNAEIYRSDICFRYRINVETNISTLEKYIKEEYLNKGLEEDNSDPFVRAVELQIDLYNLAYRLVCDCMAEDMDNYKETLNKLKAEEAAKEQK